MSRLLAIEVDNKTKRHTVLLNTIKMLSNRDLINKSKVNKLFDNIKDKLSNNLEYIIDTDKGNNFKLKFVDTVVQTITKVPGIIDFLEDKKNTYNKILVVEDIKLKAYKQILEYNNIEVFWHYELMINLIDSIYVPKHEVLDENLEKYYLINKNNCPKLEMTDPVARYYNLVPGQYVRIIRPSINSGYYNSYRVVVYSSFSKLFER